MSDVARLIEKLGLAIHGEVPHVVIDVLAAFTAVCLVKWGVTLEQFTQQLREAMEGSDVQRS